jgi:hypothetical protein
MRERPGQAIAHALELARRPSLAVALQRRPVAEVTLEVIQAAVRQNEAISDIVRKYRCDP